MNKLLNRITRTGLMAGATLGLLASPLSSAYAASSWNIGSGIYDVTGPAADAGMVGYGDTSQTTKGIHTRLWSRAYVIEKPATGKRVAFVSADLQSIPQGVKQAVMAKLKSRYGNLYDDSNVMLTATHTHVGPGGYDHYVLLNLSALGYDELNFNVIVDGIYQSIVRATDTLAPGSIKYNRGDLLDTSYNRNMVPYAQNPDAANYEHTTNKSMSLLKFVRDDGTEVGMVNWFPVHNVSNDQSQRLISADNKGIASQLFERDHNADYSQALTFVAAFANSNEGDVSPNSDGQNTPGSNHERAITSGQKQYAKARSLYDNASITLSSNGNLDYRHQYVDFPGYQVGSEFTGSGNATICEGAIGWSMVAGSDWDGPTNMEGIFEGMTVDNEGTEWNKDASLYDSYLGKYALFGWMNLFSGSSLLANADDDPCQYPKPTFVNREALGAELYTTTLPFQMFVLDSLAIVSVPGEMTTMAGRRLEAHLLGQLAPMGVDKIVIAGLANAYTGYITTPEEYSLQYYEGGHTVYGANTLAGYTQIYHNMANALVSGASVDAGPTPQDLSDDQIINKIGVVYDDKRLWESFGQVTKDTNSSYKYGDTVMAEFRSGHPRNNLKTMDTFLKVQRKVNGSWETVLTDNDIETEFKWIRDTDADCLACSNARVYWTPSADTPSGTYRLKHQGHWKSGWTGNISSYSGTSDSFTYTK